MHKDKKFDKMSQDERRHEEQHEVHPSEPLKNLHSKIKSEHHPKHPKKR
ncbi:MAG: hypothetical protein P4L65_04500 [Legionella sp.]|nr:hypothetical protein [Legionella sp.]